MQGLTSAGPKTNARTRQGPTPDETATVPVLLDWVAQKAQRDQVRAILQNRPSGDLALDDGTAQIEDIDQVPEQAGPDIIEV